MTRVALLRIGVVLFAFGYGLLTDANIGRIIKSAPLSKAPKQEAGFQVSPVIVVVVGMVLLPACTTWAR